MSPSTGAIEKQKLVYILNRDAAARLTISSPLEAHKANTLVYHVVGVDVGFENPMFACLEMDYEVYLTWSQFFYYYHTPNAFLKHLGASQHLPDHMLVPLLWFEQSPCVNRDLLGKRAKKKR